MRRGKITNGVLCVLLCYFCAADRNISLFSFSSYIAREADVRMKGFKRIFLHAEGKNNNWRTLCTPLLFLRFGWRNRP